jgi:hypothetical protein
MHGSVPCMPIRPQVHNKGEGVPIGEGPKIMMNA